VAEARVSNAFTITVDGTPLPADVQALMVSAIVEDNLNLPDLVVLSFRDPDRVVLAKSGAKVGSELVVSAGGTGQAQPQKLVTAEVTAVEAEFDATGTFTTIRGYDPVHRLFRGRRTETYTQVTASDVAKKVAQRAGLKLGQIDSTTTVFEHVTQGGVSDWEFIDRLAREIGREVRVVDGRFEFRAPRPAADAPAPGSPKSEPLALHQGTDLLRFRTVVTSAQQVKEVQVRGWDVAEKRALIGTAPSKSTGTELQGASPTELAKVFGDPVYVASDVPYRSQAEVDSAATSLAEEFGGAFAEFEGVARGNPAIRAGSAIAIAGMGAPFDGRYVVTTTRHTYDQGGGYTTHLVVSGRQDRSLLGLASGGAGGTRGLAGVVVAVVSDVRDPENLGRVKLTFPWLSDDYVSDWARTVHAGAGKDRGWFVLPEVGDEVLTAFEQGDVRRPYVLGGLYNGKDTPNAKPMDAVDGGSGAVARRSLVSRQGHRLDLLDKDGGPEGVSITTKDDKLTFVMDATGTAVTLHSDGTVLIEAKQGVTIDAGSSSMKLTANDISMTAKTGVKIDGGSGEVAVSTNGQLSLSGTMAKLAGSGQTEITGGIVRIN
jgi:phage protein D/phage baseplate assembly protein gpV